MFEEAVFSTACFPCIEYMALLLATANPIMEVHEHFAKQTIRSRYYISGPKGLQMLSVPVVHNKLYKTSIREIRISYDTFWQRTHWRSIESAYNRSAFFEFYKDSLLPLFNKPYPFLFDFNAIMLEWVLSSIKNEIQWHPTAQFEKTINKKADFRELSNQKSTHTIRATQFKPYPQVFQEENGFLPNLSILDLLFNLGPGTKNYLDTIR